MKDSKDIQGFVDWFRNSSPYINAFRERCFVIAFGGEMVAEKQFASLVHDIALLHSLGVYLVLVHGARPQIEQALERQGAKAQFVNGLRITDQRSLDCVKEAAGSVRVEIEALLSMGLANSPMAGSQIRVVSGNFVTAQPLGIRDGVDYLHTGEVRKIDTRAIREQHTNGNLVLMSPVGYSPTGEVFNLTAEDVATATAIQLRADKLIYLIDGPGLVKEGRLVRELMLEDVDSHLSSAGELTEPLLKSLFSAIYACRGGVRRSHLIDRNINGSLLLELFSRDGIGTMVSSQPYEDLRQATINDVGGILELIEPLEAEGVLVRRSRERLEMEINHFYLLERDGAVVACAALYPFPQGGIAELACLAVESSYRNSGRGDALLEAVTRKARDQGIGQLFVLTTRTSHWFQERGFTPSSVERLPMERKSLYNYQRNSKVFIKSIK